MAGGDKDGIVRRRLTDGQKAAVLAEAFGPGGSVAAVAERLGISTAAIYLWRRQLRDDAPSGPVAASTPAPAFTPVRIAAEVSAAPPRPPVQHSPSPRSAAGRIEIALGNGRRLTVDDGIDPTALARLVAVLDDGARLRQDGEAS